MTSSVLAISLNPAYDLIGFVPKIKRGAVNGLRTLDFYAAGKGMNVARVLRALDRPVAISGFLGRDNAQDFLQDCQRLSIAEHFLRVPGRTRINVKLAEADGTVTDCNFSGFPIAAADWQHFQQTVQPLAEHAAVVAVCGSLPADVHPDAFADWLTRLQQMGVKLVLDTSGAALTSGLSALPWLVKPNRHELETVMGRELPTLPQVAQAARELHQRGVAQVVVSLGAEGALWVNADGAWLAVPPQVQVVSTSGAGDSMVAGLIHGMLDGLLSPDCLALACALAVQAVQQSTVGVHDRHQLAALMAQINVRPYSGL